MRTPESGLPWAAPEVTELFDPLPVAVAELSSDGTVLQMNRALRRLLRHAGPSIPGMRLEDLGWDLPEEDRAAVLASLLAEADAEDDADVGAEDDADRPSDTEPGRLLRLRHRDGAELFVRACARRVHTVDDQVAYVMVIADVTPEHRLSEELREQREHYRILADHVGDVVLVHRGHTIVWASPSVAHVLGRDPQSLVGKTLADLGDPDALGDLPPLPETGTTTTHRVRLRHADGTLHWFQSSITARRRYGHPPAIYAWLRDIDEQVRAEQALAHSEQRLRRAVDASPDGWAILSVGPAKAPAGPAADGSVAVSADGLRREVRYELLNVRGQQDARRTEAEIVGRDVDEVLPPAAAAAMRAQVERAMASGEVVAGRGEATLDGERRVYDGFAVRLDDETVLSSWRDVTELVTAEEMLARAYEETAEMRATLQTALDATSDGFAVYQLTMDENDRLSSMRVVHANTAGALSLDRDADELIGMEIREFFAEVESSGLWEKIVLAAMTKEPQHHRVHMYDEAGDWLSAWDNTVAPVGEERMAITWRNVSKEEDALRQLARTRDEAMHSATHDALTNLPNRVLLREHLQEALRTCLHEERVGLVFVDLDRFKAINDTYGHAAGDVVLRATATRLGRLVRHGDLAARLAGDEFILVLTALSPDWSPEQFFARASAQLSEPVWADGVELHPSASLGAVLANPCKEPEDVDNLIKRADAAMYRAKAASRQG